VIGSNPSAHQFVFVSITRYCRNVGDGAFDNGFVGKRDFDGDDDGDSDNDVDGAADTDGILDGNDDGDADGGLGPRPAVVLIQSYCLLMRA